METNSILKQLNSLSFEQLIRYQKESYYACYNVCSFLFHEKRFDQQIPKPSELSTRPEAINEIIKYNRIQKRLEKYITNLKLEPQFKYYSNNLIAYLRASVAECEAQYQIETNKPNYQHLHVVR